jgi:hypothetical protein
LKGTKVSNLYEYEFHFWPCKWSLFVFI